MRLYNDFYFERHNSYWESMARKKLNAVFGDTKMLVCAEDLGLMPACVQGVLEQMRMLSLEVQSMPKQRGDEFAHLESYPYCNVAVPTTHDMAPLVTMVGGEYGADTTILEHFVAEGWAGSAPSAADDCRGDCGPPSVLSFNALHDEHTGLDGHGL